MAASDWKGEGRARAEGHKGTRRGTTRGVGREGSEGEEKAELDEGCSSSLLGWKVRTSP